MDNRTSRIAIPKDVRDRWMASIAIWHLHDALEDRWRTFKNPLPDERVREMREARDLRIIAEARAANDRAAAAFARMARSSSGE